MILVTGTKRSGTSMWMQILKAAELPVLGNAFPKNWGRSIRAANQEGFYESELCSGIYYATNPNPKTGLYLAPEATRRAAVKVFVPGLVRSDLAFIDRVIATMRSVREYGPSIARLYRMEHEHKLSVAREQGEDESSVPVIEHVPAELIVRLDMGLHAADPNYGSAYFKRPSPQAALARGRLAPTLRPRPCGPSYLW